MKLLSWFLVGFLTLLVPEILRVYWIMPFPGSQQSEIVETAYFLHNYILIFRLIGLVLIAYPLIYYFRNGKLFAKILVSILMIFYGVVFYYFNFEFLADKIFYQPKNKVFLMQIQNKIPKDRLVIGVNIKGEAKAYPIEIIGYHHQVQDTIGGEPVLVTYCTVCRTGRVFSPLVNGVYERFRLVGMDHFNAMFEDETTKSWWRQVSGEAIVGPSKGKQLKEIPCEQMSLAAWLRMYPDSRIMQRDTVFTKKYKSMVGYDKGKVKRSLTGTDSLSWKAKSWVIGIDLDKNSRAYDWNDLKKQRIIEDELSTKSLIIVLEADNYSFHSWSREVNGKVLNFVWKEKNKTLQDTDTQSVWNLQGICIEGKLKDSRLKLVQSYLEYWHSWQAFHPKTSQFTK